MTPMSRRFEEADLSRVRPTTIAGRESRVRVEHVVDPRVAPLPIAGPDLARAFPGILN